MPHYVYVLRSRKDGENYVGCTHDLKKRLQEHANGRVASTSARRPLGCIYAEIFLNARDAFTREKFLKTGWGKNYLKRVLYNYFKSEKLGGERK